MRNAERERNGSIIQLRKNGASYVALAQQFGLSRDRVRQIVELAARAEKRRAELVERYGPRPDIAALTDDTPIDVLELCDGAVHGWTARISHLKHSNQNPIGTLGELRRVSDRLLLKEPNVGKKMLAELRRLCPSQEAGEEARFIAATRKTAGRALGSLKRALGDIEELQRLEIGGAAPSAARVKWLLEDARTELGKVVGLVERMRALSKSD